MFAQLMPRFQNHARGNFRSFAMARKTARELRLAPSFSFTLRCMPRSLGVSGGIRAQLPRASYSVGLGLKHLRRTLPLLKAALGSLHVVRQPAGLEPDFRWFRHGRPFALQLVMESPARGSTTDSVGDSGAA
jgi:hypothetical protein